MSTVTPMLNAPLAKPLRSQLENAVKTARDVAEKAAKAALAQLATGEAKVPDYLSQDQKALRRRLRAHGRALGDIKHKDETQGLQHLVWEVAYEHWHRMLFARFLAENHLLLWEPGAPVTLAECDEIAQDPAMASVEKLGAKSGWALAAMLAARMLPQVFKPASPVFELTFAPEHQRELERLLAALPEDVFKASDSLGWVYQFWQAKRKAEVNESEVKIGADELPAVTQLFTEPYMVEFLLHNSLGAWWVTRHPGQPCPAPLTYLRALEDGTPAAGKFEGWPDRLEDLKLLDPCCGSGHFLVAAFLLLVPMRMSAEGLSAMDAVDAVLADNLHGLEIDPRCVEIAVFALALAAWRFPDEDGNPLGVRADMPAPNVACCGLKVAASPRDWEALVPDDAPHDAPHAAHLREGLRRLHSDFADAPLLGSLLDPGKQQRGDLFAADFSLLTGLLHKALTAEHQPGLWDESASLWDNALSAQGLLAAARLLAGRYHLVITNVPYLVRGKQSVPLREFASAHYGAGQNDLATVFLSRCLELCEKGAYACLVSPQNWLYQSSYKELRKHLLTEISLRLIARLGAGAFETIGGEVVKVALCAIENICPSKTGQILHIDVSSEGKPADKARQLRAAVITPTAQLGHQLSPGVRILSTVSAIESTLADVATALHGQAAGDNSVFNRCFWELPQRSGEWEFYQQPPDVTNAFVGREGIVFWEKEGGAMARLAESVRHLNHKAQQWRSGKPNWGKKGVAVNLVGNIYATYYTGEIYAQSCCVIVPNDSANVPAIWSFASSGELARRLREIDPGVAVSVRTVLAVPFDREEWSDSRSEHESPDSPDSTDPTQWLFHGHPQPSTDPLQVAVSRLAGYRWPAETDMAMELSGEARTWIARCDALAPHTDDDGIVCLPSVRGEKPAHDRLLSLLIAARETTQPGSWKAGTLDKLLADNDCAGKGIDVWLRDKFFEQHAKRFHHRPFIWHVWDGLKDGFGALVNYHKLDAKNLDRLIHTYLGDWIRNQEASVAKGTDGAQLRLAAALDLKRRLELIQQGEFDGKVGYDIFVRWKPIAQQPIGWNPDLNDGVRMNIRPFVTAEVLRHNKKPKLNITWDKDRGKDVESAPWFKVFKGERINDHHLTLAEKRAARGTP